MKWYDGFNRFIIGILPILVPLYVIAIAIQLFFTCVMYFGEPEAGWLQASWIFNSLASFLLGLLIAGAVLVLAGILLELKSRTN